MTIGGGLPRLNTFLKIKKIVTINKVVDFVWIFYCFDVDFVPGLLSVNITVILRFQHNGPLGMPPCWLHLPAPGSRTPRHLGKSHT